MAPLLVPSHSIHSLCADANKLLKVSVLHWLHSCILAFAISSLDVAPRADDATIGRQATFEETLKDITTTEIARNANVFFNRWRSGSRSRYHVFIARFVFFHQDCIIQREQFLNVFHQVCDIAVRCFSGPSKQGLKLFRTADQGMMDGTLDSIYFGSTNPKPAPLVCID